jgi:hypothetical protein
VDRPALHLDVLPELSRLARRAEGAVRLPSGATVSIDEPPALLTCPITQVTRTAAPINCFDVYKCLCLLWHLRSGPSLRFVQACSF